MPMLIGILGDSCPFLKGRDFGSYSVNFVKVRLEKIHPHENFGIQMMLEHLFLSS